jgi:hypothetical protein
MPITGVIRNLPAPFPLIPRGKPVNLGPITATEDIVQFAIPADSFPSRGSMTIAISGGNASSYELDCSIDGGTTWFIVTLPAAITTAAFGDTAVSAAYAPINVAGLGGAFMRFGRHYVGGGNAFVWVLLG